MKTYYFSIDVRPVRPNVNEEFQRWLERKKLSVTEFSDWVKNKVPFKPYFPWQEDIYAANIIDMVLNLSKDIKKNQDTK
jgi:hypothetical protein